MLSGVKQKGVCWKYRWIQFRLKFRELNMPVWFPTFFLLFFCIYVILLCACVSLGHLHNHIAVNYDKSILFLIFFANMMPYMYGKRKKKTAKIVCRVLKELWNYIDCHRLISSIRCLPLLTFFSRYESSGMKPYVVSRNQLNSKHAAESLLQG